MSKSCQSCRINCRRKSFDSFSSKWANFDAPSTLHATSRYTVVSKSTKNCRRGIEGVEGSGDVDEKLSSIEGVEETLEQEILRQFSIEISKFRRSFDVSKKCRRLQTMVWLKNIRVGIPIFHFILFVFRIRHSIEWRPVRRKSM